MVDDFVLFGCIGQENQYVFHNEIFRSNHYVFDAVRFLLGGSDSLWHKSIDKLYFSNNTIECADTCCPLFKNKGEMSSDYKTVSISLWYIFIPIEFRYLE